MLLTSIVFGLLGLASLGSASSLYGQDRSGKAEIQLVGAILLLVFAYICWGLS